MLQTKLIYEARCASPDSCAKAAAGKNQLLNGVALGVRYVICICINEYIIHISYKRINTVFIYRYVHSGCIFNRHSSKFTLRCY